MQLAAFAEERAHKLRHIAGVSLEERLDPIACVGRFGAILIGPEQIQALSTEEREAIDNLSVKDFSGGARALPDGTLMIIANPKQTIERLRVTIMEEVAHQHLGHRPTIITSGPKGEGQRTYDHEAELEAYWTAAATLLPHFCISRAVWQRQSATAIASQFGVSVELVEFRIKILNLWDDYQRHCPQTQRETIL